MKKTIAGIFAGALAVIALGDDYHTFTDAQGRTMEAKLLEVHAAKGKVQIER